MLKEYIYKVLKKENFKKEKMKRVSILDRLKLKKLEIKNNNYIKAFSLKLKDASLVISAIVLIWIGYVNFSSNSVGSSELAKSSNRIGDVELVSSPATIVENDNNDIVDNLESADKEEMNGQIVENKEDKDEKNQNENNKESENVAQIENNNNTNNESSNEIYFSELKLERDKMYSKSLETYQQIIDSNISNEQKAIAIQEIEKINNIQNEIKIAEELIKLKGFDDVVVYKNDESVSVIIRAAALSNSQVAQVQNIASRELKVDISKISISNK